MLYSEYLGKNFQEKSESIEINTFALKIVREMRLECK